MRRIGGWASPSLILKLPSREARAAFLGYEAVKLGTYPVIRFGEKFCKEMKQKIRPQLQFGSRFEKFC